METVNKRSLPPVILSPIKRLHLHSTMVIQAFLRG
ncbi:unnamed protein product, partial [Brugia timori]|uniref:Uncharacterized protein n=1 Tax=Brugia timori TaxID=42155 RepID=A0A0R3RAB7_9BILA